MVIHLLIVKFRIRYYSIPVYTILTNKELYDVTFVIYIFIYRIVAKR